MKFVFYVSSITFATNIAAPYFSVHMLRDLHFNYVSFMAVTLAPTLSGLIAFPLWGRHADQVGNARILKLTGLLIPIIPILWLFTHQTAMLFLIECCSGFIWGGFNLCAVNFIYDAVSPGKRVRCLSYFNLINGLAIFFGAWLGGWLSTHLMPVFGYPLLGLFLVSAAARCRRSFPRARRKIPRGARRREADAEPAIIFQRRRPSILFGTRERNSSDSTRGCVFLYGIGEFHKHLHRQPLRAQRHLDPQIRKPFRNDVSCRRRVRATTSSTTFSAAVETPLE